LPTSGEKANLHSSGALRSVERQFFADVSGQRIGPIFFDYFTFEDGTGTLSRNVGK
jgi:hypothetical protein